jgi:hypothetical protein
MKIKLRIMKIKLRIIKINLRIIKIKLCIIKIKLRIIKIKLCIIKIKLFLSCRIDKACYLISSRKIHLSISFWEDLNFFDNKFVVLRPFSSLL